MSAERLHERNQDLEDRIRVERKAFAEKADPAIQNRPTAW